MFVSPQKKRKIMVFRCSRCHFYLLFVRTIQTPPKKEQNSQPTKTYTRREKERDHIVFSFITTLAFAFYFYEMKNYSWCAMCEHHKWLGFALYVVGTHVYIVWQMRRWEPKSDWRVLRNRRHPVRDRERKKKCVCP